MTDEIIELSCNLDDMTPEGVGFALETLLAEGALDAFTTAIGMKKSRPGIMLTCLCRPEEGEKMARLLLRHTTTLGIRETRCKRYILERSLEERETEYGPVRVKRSEGFGVSREKPEYEDLCRIARERGLSLEEVRKLIK
ncbi:nickel insertion protein [Acutalibacter muris]|uniref:nickel insertion protein n=1 Tax=Acutalibacter muris TaxID=1796620 RepID=UPI001C3E92C3|nr:nickel insertion protein [Acutalibacter muris]